MKRKVIIITIAICSVILLSATIFSILKFSVWNPFSSCFGMLEILFTDKEYTIVQNIPNRVGFSKTADTSNKSSGQYLDEYMESRGFYFVPEEQMGECWYIVMVVKKNIFHFLQTNIIQNGNGNNKLQFIF